jgi:hypothetical protein
MTIVVLPPELSDLSDLEDFLSVQRSQPFLLLRVFLLDLDCTSGKRKVLSLLSCDLCLLFSSSPELMLSLFSIIVAFLIVSFLACKHTIDVVVLSINLLNVITVVLSINDKHILFLKNMPTMTLCFFGGFHQTLGLKNHIHNGIYQM